MFWLRNEKNTFQLHTLIWGPVVSKFHKFSKVSDFLNESSFSLLFQKGTMASKYISFLMNKMIDEDMEKGDNFTDKPVHVQVPEVGKIYILKPVVSHSHITFDI